MPSNHRIAITRTPPVRLRPIALPVEHGGWGLLAAPVILGLWLAPSLAGIGLSVAALGAFLVRQPLKLAFGDYQRGKRYPRTVWAERFALGYGAIALIGLICAIISLATPFWLPIVLATPFALGQLFFDLRKESRALVAELFGAVAISALAAAIMMAAGRPASRALLALVAAGVTSRHRDHLRPDSLTPRAQRTGSPRAGILVARCGFRAGWRIGYSRMDRRARAGGLCVGGVALLDWVVTAQPVYAGAAGRWARGAGKPDHSCRHRSRHAFLTHY